MKLNYTDPRIDGTTISQLRGFILCEDATIAELKERIRSCEQTRADYISRLSNEERIQLATDNSSSFPNPLPTTKEIPYIFEKA